MQPRTHRLDSRTRVFTMVMLYAIVLCIGSAGRVHADEKSAVSLEAELLQLIADCNRFVEGGKAKRRAMAACEEVAKARLDYLLDPVASAAYQQYLASFASWRECMRTQVPAPIQPRCNFPR